MSFQFLACQFTCVFLLHKSQYVSNSKVCMSIDLHFFFRWEFLHVKSEKLQNFVKDTYCQHLLFHSGHMVVSVLDEPTRTLVPCWMPKPLPPRNQWRGWFAPAVADVVTVPSFQAFPSPFVVWQHHRTTMCGETLSRSSHISPTLPMEDFS